MFLAPIPPPYDPLEWAKKPFADKSRMVCTAWAMQGYGTPLGVYLVYAIKIVAYVAGWVSSVSDVEADRSRAAICPPSEGFFIS